MRGGVLPGTRNEEQAFGALCSSVPCFSLAGLHTLPTFRKYVIHAWKHSKVCSFSNSQGRKWQKQYFEVGLGHERDVRGAASWP